MKRILIKIFSVLAIVGVFSGCSNKDPYDVIVPPQLASFSAGSSSVFGVPSDPNATFKIPVGFTTVSDKDRQIQFTITTPDAAKADFTVLNNPITIKAGAAADSLIIKGNYNSFANSDDIDSVYISINATADVKPASFNNSYKLAMRRFCPTNVADFAGNFVVVADAFEDTRPGDILVLTQISATQFSFRYPSATNAVPIVVTINPTTNAVTIERQTIGTEWSWQPTYKNPSVQGTGTYESCNKVLTLAMTWGINGGASVFTGGPFRLQIRKQ